MLELPDEIQQLIAEKIDDSDDFAHFAFTCKSLRSICYRSILGRFRNPVLMISFKGRNQEPFHFNLVDNKFYRFPAKRVYHGNRFEGFSSSQGWLIYPIFPRVRMINPFLHMKCEYDLPGINHGEDFFQKAVLSHSPTRNPDKFIIVGICGLGDWNIAVYKHEERAQGWTTLVYRGNSFIEDVIYTRKSFYGISSDGVVSSIDVSPPIPTRLPISPPMCPYNQDVFLFHYLVESCGAFLGVRRILGEVDDGAFETVSPPIHDMGIFSLEDNSIHPYFEMESSRDLPAPLWIKKVFAVKPEVLAIYSEVISKDVGENPKVASTTTEMISKTAESH
ncbi:hypothetical protein FRX31_025513 [Thalictrum thalictroides]|uniref:F-box domain-containing protein n=1 Tax=Thalictrum thalictroides TaxID=46969 RepID=A0A7J6VJG7_THATH|nr:hypothetical protein FRX31_025513 [Thalictrum thalictroides]